MSKKYQFLVCKFRVIFFQSNFITSVHVPCFVQKLVKIFVFLFWGKLLSFEKIKKSSLVEKKVTEERLIVDCHQTSSFYGISLEKKKKCDEENKF
jgi:nicotinamide riboside transporter PnuC